MKEGKAESNNRGLVILLCVLGVMIVGLGIGIGVAIVNNGQTEEPEKTEEIVEEEEEADIVDQFLLRDGPVDTQYTLDLIRTAEELDSVEEGIRLYEAVIATRLDNLEELLALRISYCKFLLNNDYTDAGLAQLDLIDRAALDVMQEIKLYIAYRNAYIYIEDETMAAEYSAKINKLMEENDISENAEF